MNTSSFLPNIRRVPLSMAIEGLVGFCYSAIVQVDPILTTTLFATRQLAQFIFYQIAHLALKGRGLSSNRVFIGVSTVTNVAFILTLRQLNLIGWLFSCMLGVAMLGELIHRVSIVQDQERLVLA